MVDLDTVCVLDKNITIINTVASLNAAHVPQGRKELV